MMSILSRSNLNLNERYRKRLLDQEIILLWLTLKTKGFCTCKTVVSLLDSQRELLRKVFAYVFG